MRWFRNAFETVKDFGKTVVGAGIYLVKGTAYIVSHPKGAALSVKNFANNVADNPVRSAKLVGQGLINGTGSLVGLAGDVALMGYNTVVPKKYQTNFSCTQFLVDGLNKVTGMDKVIPKNDYERVLLYGTQGIGEFVGFAAISAVTFGAGGAAMAGLRGIGLTNRLARAGTFTSQFLKEGSIAKKALNITTMSSAKSGWNFATKLSWLGTGIAAKTTGDQLKRDKALTNDSYTLAGKAYLSEENKRLNAEEAELRRLEVELGIGNEDSTNSTSFSLNSGLPPLREEFEEVLERQRLVETTLERHVNKWLDSLAELFSIAAEGSPKPELGGVSPRSELYRKHQNMPLTINN